MILLFNCFLAAHCFLNYYDVIRKILAVLLRLLNMFGFSLGLSCPMRAKRNVSLAEGDRIFRKEDRKKILYEKLQQMPINISARLLKTNWISLWARRAHRHFQQASFTGHTIWSNATYVCSNVFLTFQFG